MAYHVQQYRRSSSESTSLGRLALPDTSRRRQQLQSVRVASTTPNPPEPPRSSLSDSKPTTPKLPVQAPSSVLSFFSSVILYVCKFYVYFPARVKVPIYLITVFIISAAGDLLRPTKRIYLAQPDNFLRLWFVDYADVWTFGLLIAYVTMTAYFYSGGRRNAIMRNLTRVLIALIVSLSIKFVFGSIRVISGFCSNEEIKRQVACISEGHRWISFEASEEAFFLIYHTLVIMEEVGNFNRWESLDFALQKDPWNVLLSPEQTARNVVFAKRTYGQYSGTVKLLFFLLAVLCATWDVMLVMTSFFYEHLPQKCCASLFACLVWFFTYRLWYPVSWPRLPAVGMFREMPSKSRK